MPDQDIVRVAAGTLVEMQALHDALEEAGVTGRVVGDELSAGLGTTLPGSVELWVTGAEAERAAEILRRHEAESRKPERDDDA